MFNWTRALRWMMVIASGSMLLQVDAGCMPALEAIQTAILAGIGGGVYFLARNI